jgi:L-asparaginase
MTSTIVVLGTGGTIAGLSAEPGQAAYKAAELSISQLLQGVPQAQEALRGCTLAPEQVAQLDSKDMDFPTLALLARRCAEQLARAEVRGVVITHGTDTLEETAYFLHRVLPQALQAKPVVLTCAMRAANSPQADGPGNLRDAFAVATESQARGVLAVCAGQVHGAQAVQKVHTHALDAFSSGGSPAAQIHQLRIQWNRTEIAHLEPKTLDAVDFINKFATKNIANQAYWPRVEMLMNHVGASGAVVRALLADKLSTTPLRGLVVAGTGNGSLSDSLHAALVQAQEQGIEVRRASRCAWGGVQAWPGDDLPCSPLSAVKARVELVLELLAR